MSLRKLVGLLAGFALAVGLIGAGVSASFTDSVTAQENINVGTFSCAITLPSAGTLSNENHTLTYDAGAIDSSAAGSAPLTFTVKNTGSIAQVQTIASAWTGNLPANFTDMLTAGAQTVPGGDSHTYNAGITWSALDNSALGKSGSIKYTVACGELPTVTSGQIAGLVGAAGVRYKAHNTGNDIYLGIDGLGTGSPSRVEGNQTFSDGTYPVTFAFDKAANRVTETVAGLTYDFTTHPAPTCAIGSWNALQLLVRSGAVGTTSTTAFNDVKLDGLSLGSFTGTTYPGATWSVTGFDFTSSFTVTGNLVVSGWWTGSPNENAKLDITVGCH
jgi:predicted ribosomally synthesized peptide with SipW-like signal peptide